MNSLTKNEITVLTPNLILEEHWEPSNKLEPTDFQFLDKEILRQFAKYLLLYSTEVIQVWNDTKETIATAIWRCPLHATQYDKL